MQCSPQSLKLEEARGFNVFGSSAIQETKLCISTLHPGVAGLFLSPELDPERKSQWIYVL